MSFEQMCLEVGVGELLQLLRYLKMATTPTPTDTTPTKVEEEAMEVVATATTSADPPQVFIEKPIHISV